MCEEKKSTPAPFTFLLCCMIFAALASCADVPYGPPNYDNTIGREFENSIFRGRKGGFVKVREINGVEELESHRPDGCILVFGVRQSDDVIQYWRIDSGDGSCWERKVPLNR